MLDILSLLGLSILVGYIGGEICDRINQPRVVGWILAGVFLGESGAGLLSFETLNTLNPINFFVLTLIGFNIGGELSWRMLRKLGKTIAIISIFEALGSFAMVTAAVTLFTGKLWMGLIFGGLSCATAPAATVDVLREYHSAGPLTSTTFAVVGIDDALAIIIYTFAAGFAKMVFTGEPISLLGMTFGPVREIVGGILLGGVFGLFFAYITKFVHDSQKLLLLTSGALLFCCGISHQLHLSYILASMALGMTMINLPFGDNRCFDIVSGASAPVYILFFVFVGAMLRVGLLMQIGAIGVLYILFRTVGKGGGSWVAARISATLGFIRKRSGEVIEKYFWLCLFSQAGVAIGLSIEAAQDFAKLGPAGAEFGTMIITIIAGTTLFFQIIGPPCTKLAIFKAGEARKIEEGEI